MDAEGAQLEQRCLELEHDIKQLKRDMSEIVLEARKRGVTLDVPWKVECGVVRQIDRSKQ